MHKIKKEPEFKNYLDARSNVSGLCWRMRCLLSGFQGRAQDALFVRILERLPQSEVIEKSWYVLKSSSLCHSLTFRQYRLKSSSRQFQLCFGAFSTCFGLSDLYRDVLFTLPFYNASQSRFGIVLVRVSTWNLFHSVIFSFCEKFVASHTMTKSTLANKLVVYVLQYHQKVADNSVFSIQDIRTSQVRLLSPISNSITPAL